MQGGLLAVLVILIFLVSLRATGIIGVAIPLSIMATFVLLYFTGQTLNVFTLGGLALGVGRLVDDSIVELENIHRHLGPRASRGGTRCWRRRRRSRCRSWCRPSPRSSCSSRCCS